MTMNVSNTVFMPFRPCSLHLNSLRPCFNSLGVRLLDSPTLTNFWAFKLFRPMLFVSFNQLLAQLHQCALLRRWRARNICGLFPILRTVIILILWHVSWMIYFSGDQVSRLRPIHHNFVQTQTTNDLPTSSTPG